MGAVRIKIAASVYQRMMMDMPYPPPESGGILGSRDGVVCKIYLDQSQQSQTSLIYQPDIEQLNHQIQAWQQDGIRFAGMFHTHIAEEETLSGDDLAYIKRIVHVLPKGYGQLFFPIVIPNTKIIMYSATAHKRDVFVGQEDIEIIRDEV